MAEPTSGLPGRGDPDPMGTRGRPGPRVFVFNPFAEGYLARGDAFTPVKHQAMLAEDLANLPQFLCQLGDIVLVPQRPSAGFLRTLEAAGFVAPEFVEIGGCRGSRLLSHDPLGGLCPWAWGPDSVRLFKSLLAGRPLEAQRLTPDFTEASAQLYSKAWSAHFLRRLLGRCRGGHEATPGEPKRPDRLDSAAAGSWLCAEQDVGVAVNTLEEALEAIAAIRARGHLRVVVKQALGLAGHNAIRLWEPALLPTQRQWLIRTLGNGQALVVEPWLERELDFSVQLEMGPRGLEVCGYTGLINDRRGQFLGNWAEPGYRRSPPAQVAAAFPGLPDFPQRFQALYAEVRALLAAELQAVAFIGPVSIDAFVYRTAQGRRRLKPVVEINPRYTMGRVAVELMKQVVPQGYARFRLVNRAQARAEGFADLAEYARNLGEKFPVRRGEEPQPRLRQGVVCLNDPTRAQACLAVWEVWDSPPPFLAAAANREPVAPSHA